MMIKNFIYVRRERSLSFYTLICKQRKKQALAQALAQAQEQEEEIKHDKKKKLYIYNLRANKQVL